MKTWRPCVTGAVASSAWPEPRRLEGAKSGYQLPEPSSRLPAGNLTGTWGQENIYPWCQVPCGGGNSIFGLDQEEGIGCVVPTTVSRDLSALLPGSLSASTASLAPSFCFCSFISLLPLITSLLPAISHALFQTGSITQSASDPPPPASLASILSVPFLPAG